MKRTTKPAADGFEVVQPVKPEVQTARSVESQLIDFAFTSLEMANKYGKLFAASLDLLTQAEKLREQVRAHNSQQTAMGSMIIWAIELDKAILSAKSS